MKSPEEIISEMLCAGAAEIRLLRSKLAYYKERLADAQNLGGPSKRAPESDIRSSKEAATELARLVERQLGYQEGHIDPAALRLFIKAYWTRISVFAHTIHEDPL